MVIRQTAAVLRALLFALTTRNAPAITVVRQLGSRSK